MSRKRRQFTREFKTEALRLVEESGKPLTQVARELGIRPDLLYSWKRRLSQGANAEEVFTGNGVLTPEAEEIRRLRRRLEQVEQERDFLKKSGSVLRAGVAVKYACIRSYRTQFPVTMMCRVLGVSRSGYYAAQEREPSERSKSDQRLRLEIRTIHRESKQRYGSPRVHDELKARAVRCSEKRVARLMRLEGLRSKKRRRFRVTTNSDHAHAPADNVLARDFAVEDQAGADRVWASDITYVPTREGWLYLAVVLDLATRMVVGWAVKRTLDHSLCLGALLMAMQRRQPDKGLLLHSDRGVQYACREYRALLELHGIVQSMSRKGDCWDNAVAESFLASLEWELIEDADWRSRQAAVRDIFDYIEFWYNRKRRHSSLAGKTPAEYDDQLALNPRAA